MSNSHNAIELSKNTDKEQLFRLVNLINAEASEYIKSIEDGRPFEETKEIYLRLKKSIRLSEIFIQQEPQ